MKNLKKICIVALVLIVLFVFLQNSAFAFDWTNQINNSAGAKGNTNVINPVTNIAKSVVTITRVVAVGVAITMLIVLAIKYMSAAPSDRADIKKHAVVYVVGATIMFAVSGILGIIQNFANVI